MYQYYFEISKKISADAYAPVRWPIEFPYWLTGEGREFYSVIAYGPSEDYILRNWPEAGAIEVIAETDGPVFTSRLPCPAWYLELRLKYMREKYTIFEPDWKWGTAYILVRNDRKGFVHINFYRDEDVPSISDLFVNPGDRKSGVGNEILRDAEEIVRLRGYEEVFLWTNPSGWCRDWYLRHGYREMPDAKPTESGDIYLQKTFRKEHHE